MEYYDVPRNVSVKEIAAELGIKSSTVAEHLQRAEAKLLSHHLPDRA
jgi:predicted DNA binding protein